MRTLPFTKTIIAGTPVQVSTIDERVAAIEFHARAAFDAETGKGNKGNVYPGRNDSDPIAGQVSVTNGREITPGSSVQWSYGDDGSERLNSFYLDGDNSGDLVDVTVHVV